MLFTSSRIDSNIIYTLKLNLMIIFMNKKILLSVVVVLILSLTGIFAYRYYSQKEEPIETVNVTISNLTFSDIPKFSIETSDGTFIKAFNETIPSGESTEIEFEIYTKELKGDGHYEIAATLDDNSSFIWEFGYYTNGNLTENEETVELKIEEIKSSSINFGDYPLERNSFTFPTPGGLIIQTGTKPEYDDEGKFYYNYFEDLNDEQADVTTYFTLLEYKNVDSNFGGKENTIKTIESECLEPCTVTKYDGVVSDNPIIVDGYEVWLYSAMPKEGDATTIFTVDLGNGYNLMVKNIEYEDLTMAYIISQIEFVE